jgi:uncharacterized protein YqeY
MSTIKAAIEAAFRKARLERDEPTKTVIGMLKAEVLKELKSGKGVEENDELWLQVLAGYAKRTQKLIDELQGLGERGAEQLPEARFELAFCSGFLPSKLDEAQTEALVRKLIAEHGISDKKGMGKLMGVVMKNHKDEIDGNLVRQVAERILV